MQTSDSDTGATEGTGASNLIASDRVEGTSVKRSDGETIGTIDRLVIDKASGRVAYAIMTFGGILGTGEHEYTLPWTVLRFDTALEAYRLDLTDEQLHGAPKRDPGARDAAASDPSFDKAWEEHVHHYFQTSPYWNEDVPRATHETKAD